MVLVGNKISPGNPVTKPDGTVVRTLWGELAWQLGGKKAFARVEADDEKATSPGDVLRELFNEYGPCLILIDEWVAYARQLHDQSDLPAGGFETQFTFAQALTESAKLAKNCLLVISLPASDTAGSPHTQADDVEVGGERGREALDRLRNVVGRVESSWRPASAEEGFEIVRRRLFEPLAEPDAVQGPRRRGARLRRPLPRRSTRSSRPSAATPTTRSGIKAAYPIHPEIFDRLYTDWSTLVKFQRTRGVLRLMAAVIHSLWEKGDRNPLILPANIPIDDPRVQFELTRYLSDNWVPVIEKDVDGPNSLPLRLDGEVPNLGKFAATPARGAHDLPRLGADRDGGPSRPRGPAGQARLRDAGRVAGGLRRCAAAAGGGGDLPLPGRPALLVLDAAHGHQAGRGPRRAAQARSRQGGAGAGRAPARRPAQDGRLLPHPPAAAVGRRTCPTISTRGWSCSASTTPTARSPAARPRRPPGRSSSRAATRPRLYRNTLVFLAADKTRLQDLDEAVAAVPRLGVDPRREGRAEPRPASGAAGRDPEGSRRRRRHGAHPGDLPVAAGAGAEVARRRRSTWQAYPARLGARRRSPCARARSCAATSCWSPASPARGCGWSSTGSRSGAATTSRSSSSPRTSPATSTCRGSTDPAVLVGAVRDGVGLLTWEQETFAYADSFDEATGRYRGLRGGAASSLDPMPTRRGLLVKAGVAPGSSSTPTAPKRPPSGAGQRRHRRDRRSAAEPRRPRPGGTHRRKPRGRRAQAASTAR